MSTTIRVTQIGHVDDSGKETLVFTDKIARIDAVDDRKSEIEIYSTGQKILVAHSLDEIETMLHWPRKPLVRSGKERCAS